MVAVAWQRRLRGQTRQHWMLVGSVAVPLSTVHRPPSAGSGVGGRGSSGGCWLRPGARWGWCLGSFPGKAPDGCSACAQPPRGCATGCGTAVLAGCPSRCSDPMARGLGSCPRMSRPLPVPPLLICKTRPSRTVWPVMAPPAPPPSGVTEVPIGEGGVGVGFSGPVTLGVWADGWLPQGRAARWSN